MTLEDSKSPQSYQLGSQVFAQANLERIDTILI